MDDLKKTISKKQRDALFEDDLRHRFGITSVDLSEHFTVTVLTTEITDIKDCPFPTVNVKNIESLKKHAAEMFCFADPVKYDYAKIRTKGGRRS